MMTMLPFEQAVLDMLLDGDHPSLATLRAQARQAQVVSREFSGVGFFLEFKVPDEAERLGKKPVQLTGVVGSADNVKHGVGFVLFVRDGAIKTLEGYTYDEAWPKEFENLKLRYLKGEQRNQHDVLRMLEGD